MRRLLLTALSVCGMISAAQAQVTFKCIGGTDFSGDEGCAKAFDGNLGTKWGMYSGGDKFAVVQASQPVYLTGYTLVNANDNKKHNRDIKEWEIWGTNNESTATTNTETTTGWTLFERVREHSTGTADYAAHHFAINRPSLAYKYIMFKRVAGSGNASQLSEICLSYKTQQQKGYTILSCPTDHKDYEGADKIFDDSWNSKLCVDPSCYVNYYVTFTTTQKVKVSAINMSTANDSDVRDPKQWTLFGSSDDGKTWKEIYIHNGEDLPADRQKAWTFTVVECDTEYSLFKLEISETRDRNKDHKMQISELSLNDVAASNYTVVEATPGFSDKESAGKLFDGNTGTKWCCPQIKVKGDCPIEFTTNTALTPTGYYFVTANDDTDRDPVAWTLYGKQNDGETWDVLATKEKDVDELPTGRLKFKEYSMTAPETGYSHYKLVVTDRRGGGAGLIQIGEFGLLTASETSDSYFANNENIYVYEGSGGGDGESVIKMFDGNAETKWCTGPTHTVFGLGRKAKLSGYGIHVAKNEGEENRRPKSWTLEGSDDNSNWTEIDKVVNDDKLQAAFSALTYYTLDAPVEYKYYKFTIDATQGADIFQIGEFVPMFDGGTLDKLTLKDGVTEFTFNGNATVGELNYERSVTSGNVSTFILPVEVPVEKVNGTVWELAKYEDSALKFTKVESGTLAANKPYLVQPSSDKLIAGNKLENVRLYAAPGTEGLKKATTDGGAYQMGTYKQLASAEAVTDGTVYGYTGGKFVQAESGTLNPFRTLFVVKEGNGAAAREISLVLGDQETGIVSITKDGEIEDREVDVYDLGGRKVAQSVAGSTCLVGLQSGVYVVNGKKYVIK